MNDNPRLSTRTKIGIITIALWIGIALGAWRSYQTGNSDDPISEACNRIGIMMTILWVAWPELILLPRWIFFAIPFVFAVAAWRPIILIYAFPLFLLYWFLIPRPPKKSKNQKKHSK